MNSTGQCQDIALDIPWYVNGTLNEVQMSRVQEHIHDCDACRMAVEEELRCARRYSQHSAAMGEQLAGPEPSLSILLTDIAALKAPRYQRRRWSAIAAAVAAVVLLAFVPQLTRDGGTTDTRYEAMTTAAPDSADIVLQLVFREDAPEWQIRRIISAHGAGIVSGPTPRGVYRIGLPADTAEEDIARLLPELRREPSVLMAEREL